VQSSSFDKLRMILSKAEVSKVKSDELPKYKVEIKNINSFKFVKQAIEYEIIRQAEILRKGETPKQETRGFSESKQATYSQRSKEYAHDYRYFPEPDIPPMRFSKQEIEKIAEKVPELPSQKVQRYTEQLKIKLQDALIISKSRATAEYFDAVVKLMPQNAQNVANLIIHKRIKTDVPPEEFAKTARELSTPILTDMTILSEKIIQVIQSNPKVVEDYKSGKHNAIMYLVGLLMREMKGKADAKTVRQELEKAIKT